MVEKHVWLRQLMREHDASIPGIDLSDFADPPLNKIEEEAVHGGALSRGHFLSKLRLTYLRLPNQKLQISLFSTMSPPR